MKKVLYSVLAVVVMLMMMTSAGFAAPEYTGLHEQNSSEGLIKITNPDKIYSTTYSKSCSISGFAQSGAKIYVYYFDSSSGNYKLHYENGNPLMTTAGASGMFVIPLKLSAGSNNIIIRAEKDDEFQNMSLHINVLSASMFSIKSTLKAYKFN